MTDRDQSLSPTSVPEARSTSTWATPVQAFDPHIYRVEPGTHVDLSRIDANDTGFYETKATVTPELKTQRKRIQTYQERLYADHQQSLLIILQATDTGGKDSTIKHVFKGVNPQGCRVWSFKAPSQEELDHDFLWRHHNKAPGRGMVAIFNRSYYEEVLISRVQKLVPPDVWQARYEMINEFEHLLAQNQTTILKFYLHISKEEQRARLQSRLDDPEKHWKFSRSDLEDRAHWDDYRLAYEDAISHCSTEYAPWYIVPANHKWYRNLVVARTIADTLEKMNPQFPAPEPGLDSIVIPD